jgi:hypothetical protein
VHVQHRRGDRARLDGDGQKACDNVPHHDPILDNCPGTSQGTPSGWPADGSA